MLIKITPYKLFKKTTKVETTVVMLQQSPLVETTII